MKTFLTFFVLLFSSSVVAKDDLVGTSIVCGKILEDQKYKIQGYEFLKDNNFGYHEFVDGGKFWNVPLGELIYKTDLLYIYIHNVDNLDSIWLQISRKTLDTYIPDEDYPILVFKGDNCIIYKNEKIGINLIKMQKMLIDEIQKDNKL